MVTYGGGVEVVDVDMALPAVVVVSRLSSVRAAWPLRRLRARRTILLCVEKSDCLVVWLLVAWFSLDEESVDASGGRKPVPCGLLCRRCLVFEERHRRGVEDDLG